MDGYIYVCVCVCVSVCLCVCVCVCVCGGDVSPTVGDRRPLEYNVIRSLLGVFDQAFWDFRARGVAKYFFVFPPCMWSMKNIDRYAAWECEI